VKKNPDTKKEKKATDIEFLVPTNEIFVYDALIMRRII
jgi:hypothetical protein